MESKHRLWLAGGVLVIVGLGLLGAAFSPRLDGDPLLLSPDLARAAGYLRFVSGQLEALGGADAGLVKVLAEGEDAPDLLAQARRARAATETALAVAAAADREWTPPELESLKLALQAAALGYVEAGRLAVLFVNAPTEEAHAQAVEARERAGAALEEAGSRWNRLNPR